MAILRLTRNNKLRAAALALLERNDDDIPQKEWDALTTGRAWWLGLSERMGWPASALGAMMGSREYTERIALSLIDAARQSRPDDG